MTWMHVLAVISRKIVTRGQAGSCAILTVLERRRCAIFEFLSCSSAHVLDGRLDSICRHWSDVAGSLFKKYLCPAGEAAQVRVGPASKSRQARRIKFSTSLRPHPFLFRFYALSVYWSVVFFIFFFVFILYFTSSIHYFNCIFCRS